MLRLNDIGSKLGDVDAVSALTDVTGFGLLGHLIELAEASGLRAEVDFAQLPTVAGLSRYIEQKTIPGGTDRNFRSYGHKVNALTNDQRAILCDPQTSGGLLVAVDPARRSAFLEVARAHGLELAPFGTLAPAGEEHPTITVG